jgi:hypothetical protein
MFTFAVMAVVLAGSPVGAEAAAWTKLQRGMDTAKVAQLVGTPLLRNAARGHEVWIYDAGAHIQFHGGTVSAWTGPATPERPASPRGTTSAAAPITAKPAAG